MSPRIKRLRKVLSPPPVKSFKPFGPGIHDSKKDFVMLHYEEYEALRMCDYDKLNHHQASVLMGVSRPTFTRIYASVRQKIAMAFVEGRQIIIGGGKVYFDSDWYNCKSCKCYFNNPEKDIAIHCCPLCSDKKIVSFDFDMQNEQKTISEAHNDICICPSCGFEKEHQLGIPCSEDICPQCKTLMRRKRK